MTEPKVWVDGPFKLIPSSKVGAKVGVELKGSKQLAGEMTLVHNVLLRGLNAIYNQARNVEAKGTAKDKADFVNFAYWWAKMLEEHHDTEETTVFPDINRLVEVPGLMDPNVDEHKAFHGGFEEYMTYLDRVRNGEEEFSGDKLVAIIDSFAPVLQIHLEHEIDTLLALQEYEDKCDWGAWFKKTVDRIVSTGMKKAEYRNNVFPMAMIFHDKTFDGGVWSNFPPVPWVVALILRWLFMNTHKDWWRFSGCDFNSMPKELPFA